MDEREKDVAEVADELLALAIARAATSNTDPDQVAPFADKVLVAALSKWRKYLVSTGQMQVRG